MFFRKAIYCSCIALFLVSSVTGCGGEDDDDDNGGDDPNDRYERPEATQDMIPDSVLDDLVEGGLEVHEGFDAPSIDGTYEFANNLRTYSNSENFETQTDSDDGCVFVETYEATDSPEEYLIEIEGQGSCNYLSAENLNFISGSGECFTLYGEDSVTFEGCELGILRILSACLDSNGDLLDPARGEHLASLDGGNCSSMVNTGRIPAVGDSYIITQTDGRAPRMD